MSRTWKWKELIWYSSPDEFSTIFTTLKFIFVICYNIYRLVQGCNYTWTSKKLEKLDKQVLITYKICELEICPCLAWAKELVIYLILIVQHRCLWNILFQVSEPCQSYSAANSIRLDCQYKSSVCYCAHVYFFKLFNCCRWYLT